MRFIHTSDLHIGKSVNGFSMLEEQEHALRQILEAVGKYRVDGIFLSGDLYDRSIPPAPAVALLDWFLTELAKQEAKVFAIAGNHDCGDRIGFANQILSHHGIYIEGNLSDPVRHVDLKKEGQTVRIHLIPYARPAFVRHRYGGEGITYDESMGEILKHVEYLKEGGNILLTHQFVVNQGREPEISDSETRVCVGGADQVEASRFHGFDYVALGHIHGPQQIGNLPVYYSGSPVKYSFSEVFHQKSVILGEYQGPGRVKVRKLPITPIHDMRKIRGKLSELIREDVAGDQTADPEDYILAILTDRGELLDPMGTLRSVYPNVMQLQMEKRDAGDTGGFLEAEAAGEKSPLEMFTDFYREVTGLQLDEARSRVVREIIDMAMEEMR